MYRRAERLPTRVLIQVRTAARVFDATLGNISAGGARLVGVPDGALKVGELIDLNALGRHHKAQVRWNVDDACGLMFLKPVSQAQITAILGSRLSN